MALSVFIWLLTLFAALVTLWSYRQARLHAELKRQLAESQQRLAELQAHVQRALSDVSVLSQRRPPEDDEPLRPTSIH